MRGPTQPPSAWAALRGTSNTFAIPLFPIIWKAIVTVPPPFGQPTEAGLLFPAGPLCHVPVPTPHDAAVWERILLVEVRFLCHDAARAARGASGCSAVSQVFTASIAPPTGNSPGAGE